MKTIAGRTKVATIAGQYIDDIKHGRHYKYEVKSKFQNVEPPAKYNKIKKYFVVFFLLIGISVCFMEFTKHKVTGFAVSETNEKLKNSNVIFYCTKSEKSYSCKTDNKGDFSTRLPTGEYRVYVKEHGSLDSSKIKVLVECESNFKITSFKP